MDDPQGRSWSEPSLRVRTATVLHREIVEPVRSLLQRAGDLVHRFWSLLARVFRAVLSWTLWRPLALTGLALFLFLVIAYSAVFSWEERQTPPSATIDEHRYLDQGWGATAANSAERMTFYYSAQGAFLKNVRYDWLVALERPWKRDSFTSEKYMRAYGFIVDPTDVPANPDHLPIGLARIWDPKSESMMVDMTCAACHSGELQVMKNGRRVAVRIDGGGAMHELTSSKPGRFGTDLYSSLVATWINPFKWSRFSEKVLGYHASFGTRLKLWKELGGEIAYLGGLTWSDASRHLYPVDDGYGRTDALGRIANNVYGTHLNPKNFHPGDAPVSYPALWDTWKFDWVQYTASVAQPMARNLGETLGVGAEYSLVDAYGRPVDPDRRFATSTQVANLVLIEETLRKLKPPPWPEDLFGKIDMDKANAGKALFATYCLRCHGPHIASPGQKQIDAPLKGPEDAHWIIPTLPLQEIGTDPTTALNFVRNRYDLRETGIKAEDLRGLLGQYYKEQFARLTQYGSACQKAGLEGKTADSYAQGALGSIDLASVSNGEGLNYLITLFRKEAYREMAVTTDARRQDLDGYGQLDLPQVLPAYRVRPLPGIWATAPFLHNGSVPNLYELLLPADQRSKTFYLKGRIFDPVKVGLVTDPADPGAFLFDTSVPGNSNTGHEFRAGYVPPSARPEGCWSGESGPYAYGVIGPELTDEQRWQIIEYLKIATDHDFAPAPPASVSRPAARPPEISTKLTRISPPNAAIQANQAELATKGTR